MEPSSSPSPEPFLSLVIPAYNEEGRLPDTLHQAVSYLKGQSYSWEVVVADDGSQDGTAGVVKAFARQEPNVNLLSLPHKGKGWAVHQGMLAAQGQFRFLCDADLSMPLEHLSRFLNPPEQGAILIGSREAPGARRLGEPKYRHWRGRLFNLLVQLLALPGIEDTQCGFKLFPQEAALALFPKQKCYGFAFDVEVLFLARKLGFLVVEVPIDWYFRQESKVRLGHSLRMLLDVVKLRWDYALGRYKPLPSL